MATIGRTGVDLRTAYTLSFAIGIPSQFVCAVDGAAEKGFHILGGGGTISAGPLFSRATTTTLTLLDGVI